MSMEIWPQAVLIAAAVAPAAVLLAMVHRLDRSGREGPALLWRLAILGVLATAIARALEFAGVRVLNVLLPGGGPLYDAALYFGVVAFSEEGVKYALLKGATWNSPEFDNRFDGVVYAVFVSLGFALWENLGYVLMGGLGTALMRAVTAVPGHACFGVFMGCWYAQARFCHSLGRSEAARRLGTAALALPTLLHGAYDFLANASDGRIPWPFVAFAGALFAVTAAGVRRFARDDVAIEASTQKAQIEPY